MQSYTKYRSVTFFHEMSAKVFCDVCSTFIPSRKLLQQIILFEVSTGCGSGAPTLELMSGLGGRLWEVVAYRKFH